MVIIYIIAGVVIAGGGIGKKLYRKKYKYKQLSNKE
tara:strand:+ start:325 stop:432 length:108 start_codon:yes stop_codon:yes gene_type:complete